MAGTYDSWVHCESKKRWKSMRQNLQNLLHDSLLLDVELKTGNGSVKAHKVVLSSGSEYFRTLFTGPFKEQSQPVVDLSCTFDSVDGLQEVVNHLYGDCIEINEEKLSSILHAANVLLIPEIKIACCHFMINNVTVANCLSFWLLSDTYSLVELEDSFSRFAKVRFSDAYCEWTETLSIPIANIEKLFKCDFAKLGNAQTLELFLEKYFSHNECLPEVRERLTRVSGLREKRKTELQQNSVTIDTNNKEALLVNIDHGDSHLVYINSCDSWFKFPHNYIQGKQNIHQMCLGPGEKFYLVYDDVTGVDVKYDLVEAYTGTKHEISPNTISKVQKELTINSQVNRPHVYYIALNGELFCVLESHIKMNPPENEVSEFVEFYVFVYDFEFHKWDYLYKLGSSEKKMADYGCIIQHEVTTAYISVQIHNQVYLYKLKSHKKVHTLEQLPTFTCPNLQMDEPLNYLAPSFPNNTVRYGTICYQYLEEICYYNIALNKWENIDISNDHLHPIDEEDAERYDCTSFHFMQQSRESPKFMYFEGHYEGYCSRFFIGQLGHQMKELAPLPLVSCENIEESPVCIFTVSSAFVERLQPASCLDQLDKPLLDGCWSAYEIKEELQKRLAENY